MVDEREGHVARADLPRAFNRQSVWRRIAIVAAGPLANLLLAVLLFAGTFVAGLWGLGELGAQPPPSPAAAAADIRAGDRVVAVEAFLAGRARFSDIPRACAAALERRTPCRIGTLDDALAADAEARDIGCAALGIGDRAAAGRYRHYQRRGGVPA
jgi:hypothetical protein